MENNEFPLWEVFIRSHAGLNARDVYTRRQEGVSIWVVESKHITASDPSDADAFFDPAADKVYRHPTFYIVPDAVKHM
jgi:ring-1,2-phenylacetyl-CoA epoxidase subunit PaaB